MAGSPTWAELVAQLQAAVDIDESTRTYGADTALADIDTLVQASEGDFVPSAIASYGAAVRGALSAALDSKATFVAGWLAEVGKFISSPADPGDIDRLRRDLYDYMDTNSLSVNSRNITYATPSAGGGNTGAGGGLSRCTVDEKGYALEGCHVEAKTAIVRGDQTNGARRGAEEWEFHGTEAGPDEVGADAGGSGSTETIYTGNAGNGSGGSALQNSSFDIEHDSDDTSTSKVSGWTITSGATSLEESSTVYIEAPGVATADSRSLQFEGNAAISQKLSDFGGQVSLTNPYWIGAALYRESSCDGTFRIRMGGQSVTVDLTTHTNSTWEWLIFTPGQNSWPANFYEDELDIELSLASNTTGSVLVDNLIFAPMQAFDGTFWFPYGGATPHRLDDTYTMTDSGGAPADAKVQHFVFRSGLGYLPSDNAGTETITDPA